MPTNKRGRGRPKKPVVDENSKVVQNEEVEKVEMSSNKNGSNKGKVINKSNANMPVSINPTDIVNIDTITLERTSKRWANIFSKYADMGFNSLSNAWQKGWSQLNDPFLQNYRIKQILASSSKITAEELGDALADPENSELQLTQVSMGLYYKNFVYNFLIKLNRDTPMYKWYATPQYIDAEDMNTEKFKKESQKVDKIMKSFKPALTLKTVSTQVALEGKSSYLYRISHNENDVNFFVLQKLNTDMVKLTGFGSKQQFIASFNMIIFLQPAYDVSQYPPYIQKVWEDMNSNGIIYEDKKTGAKMFNPESPKIPKDHTVEWNGKYYMYWVKLPQELCYTFYSDGAHPNAFPDTIGLFNDLNDLDDYRWLQANLLSKGVNSVLTAEVPLVRDGKAGSDATIISPDTILGYTDFFQQNISGNIMPFFAPFSSYTLHTLENQPESLDIIYDRTRDLIATSGNASLLPITDKPSIASVKAAESIQASKNDYLTKQFEQFLNNVINSEFGLKNKWKITLWGDIFYIRDDIKLLKEMVFSGLEGFLPKLLSGVDESLEDYRCNKMYMEALEVKIEKSFDLEKMKYANDLAIQNTKESAKINNQLNKTSSISTSTIKNTTKVKTSTSENSGSVTGDSKVGRPSLSDSDVENDSTGASKDAGNNVSDIKEFSISNVNNSENNDGMNFITFKRPVTESKQINQYREHLMSLTEENVPQEIHDDAHCAKCGKELNSDEEFICDECLEMQVEEMNERLGNYTAKSKNNKK